MYLHRHSREPCPNPYLLLHQQPASQTAGCLWPGKSRSQPLLRQSSYSLPPCTEMCPLYWPQPWPSRPNSRVAQEVQRQKYHPLTGVAISTTSPLKELPSAMPSVMSFRGSALLRNVTVIELYNSGLEIIHHLLVLPFKLVLIHMMLCFWVFHFNGAFHHFTLYKQVNTYWIVS